MFLGNQKLKINSNPVSGEYVAINGESYYKISNFDKMAPFFMSIVSNSDHWMFISSNGGLTAGRKNPDNALFPYYTDDKIHTSHYTTGSKSILKVNTDEQTFLWEPFSDCQKNIYNITRNIYKNIPSNKIIFEEKNIDLGLIFSYTWLNSEKFGFVKKSEIINKNKEIISVEILDGIQNILPYGLNQKFQTELSTLADGYKRNELIEEYGIGIYRLSSIPSDKAEPSESLMATTVWSTGIEAEKYLLSSKQLDSFRTENVITQENDIKGVRGSYFLNSKINLEPDVKKEWLIIAEINQDLRDIVKIKNLLRADKNLSNLIFDDVDEGTRNLVKIVASADGLQLGEDKLVTSRHFSNVLFNVMRGGIFDDSYWVSKDDFISFLKTSNKIVLERNKNFLESLNSKINYLSFKKIVEDKGDKQLLKLTLEYLPITFSRRHGDPSRPWNRFSIDLKDKYGNKILNYEGNWRDLFQNWEALALSYPEYLESMIAKFLNASTADGYNPYRVTRSGFDWEAPEEDTPWSNIGYWGDHQIIYLLKLLELSFKFDANELTKRMSDDIYSYANVPYRICGYKDILKDPKNTIEFDFSLHEKILEKEKEIGSDARFLTNETGEIYQVNLTEKLLATLLSKLSNFIPGAGIWMNTQRPEWNDANNALVGNGVSMVTLYYIRRYLTFLINLFEKVESKSLTISIEIKDFFEKIYKVFELHKTILIGEISNKNRKQILDSLGKAGEEYRFNIYYKGFTGKKQSIDKNQIINFSKIVRECIDNTISLNERDDHLYHAYNLISVKDDEIIISNLYEMLEGQVAVISSGYLNTKQVIQILNALYKSKLYRKDQNSFILYPNRDLPKFIEKNQITEEQLNSSNLLKKLIEIGNQDIVVKDEDGKYHFNGEIRNSKELKIRLENLSQIEGEINNEKEEVLEFYELIFNHKAFTGRSGTFYKYEGLGSIYWHMVSKLVLAVEEAYFEAIVRNANISEIEELKKYYYQLKDGIGLHKSPEVYGAFPTDPNSHTPSFSGVQQPGMTGQVKEDIISRFGELGLIVKNGIITFNPILLNRSEFLKTQKTFNYSNVNGKDIKIELQVSSLAFTYCQVPIIYKRSSNNLIKVVETSGNNIEFNNLSLDKNFSHSIFNREGKVESIEVCLNL